MRVRRLLVLAATVAAFAGLESSARACSCAVPVEGALRMQLRDGQPAFVGRLVAVRPMRTARPSGEPSPAGGLARFTYRVERGFNHAFGAYVTLHADTDGAACGLPPTRGRIGLLVFRQGRRWTSSLCNLVRPRDLIRAGRRGRRAGPRERGKAGECVIPGAPLASLAHRG